MGNITYVALSRYKALAPSVNVINKDFRTACEGILKTAEGYDVIRRTEIQLGKTKMFMRDAQVLFNLSFRVKDILSHSPSINSVCQTRGRKRSEVVYPDRTHPEDMEGLFPKEEVQEEESLCSIGAKLRSHVLRIEGLSKGL